MRCIMAGPGRGDTRLGILHRKRVGHVTPSVCTENPIRIVCVTESPKRQQR